MYFLQNLHQGYLGNSPVFWANSGGYTQWIDDAKRFNKNQAFKLVTEDKTKWAIWPVEDVMLNAKRTVDIQDLNKIRDCVHERQHIPDPSGNSDSYYECIKCGKELSK